METSLVSSAIFPFNTSEEISPVLSGFKYTTKNNCDHLEENRKKIIGLENEFMGKLKETGIPFVRNGGLHTLPGCPSIFLSPRTIFSTSSDVLYLPNETRIVPFAYSSSKSIDFST